MKFETSFIDELRDRVSISDVIAPRVTWARKSRKSIGDYWACCPFHGEKSPSFHVEDRKGRYYCFGCGRSGDHFKFLQEYDGLTFPRAVEELASIAGVPMPSRAPPTEEEKQERARRERERERAKAAKEAEAQKKTAERVMSAGLIWKQSVPIAGTLAHTYFEWRCPGLAPPASETEIRFHPKLELDPDRPRGDTAAAVIARVSDVNGKGIAVWRIYLRPDGTPLRDRAGKKVKLGYGPATGGAVRLGGMAPAIGLCEGIETGRAVRELGTTFPVWPALSTSGIIGFQIPAGVKRVTVFRDPDGSKWREKQKHDGTKFIAAPPGQEASRLFRERNPGVDIRDADAAWDADYLEVLQKMKGVEIR